ncbi:putative LLM family oxidoreductase [Nitrobacteraceae bacterium AZCC 1564]
MPAMEIGIDSFAILPQGTQLANTRQAAAERMAQLLTEIETADRVGLDSFGMGEHHRPEFLDSAPTLILAAAAARTKSIRLTSAVTVLGAADPVRVFQQFATLDLISNGRAEIVVGRGSSVEAFPLFGYSLTDYDDLFAEKLDLLLKVRDANSIEWSGRFRPALRGEGIYPRPLQERLPIWLGVGGTRQSFVRAGMLGLPLMLAVIGGRYEQFRPLVDLYREAGRRAGHPSETLRVGLHTVGFVAPTSKDAANIFYPGWAQMMSSVGRERGWSTPTRRDFDVMRSDKGTFLIGDPDEVTANLMRANDILGGLSRVTFQMSTASTDHEAMTDAITLLGEKVAPAIRSASA